MNIITDYIKSNKYSRPKTKINPIRGIVIHWVANPNTTAKMNRDYFNTTKAYGSAHEIIDLNGDVILCVPENEITYNCGSATYTERCIAELGYTPNYCTYSIECTHIDWKGTMTVETYDSLVQRCIDLCIKFKLNAYNLWLHKDVVGWKDCHLWFVNNPNEWTKLKDTVQEELDNRRKIMDKPWEQLEGEKALDSLFAKGKVTEVEKWKAKDLRTNAPLWLIFLLMDRISNE